MKVLNVKTAQQSNVSPVPLRVNDAPFGEWSGFSRLRRTTAAKRPSRRSRFRRHCPVACFPEPDLDETLPGDLAQATLLRPQRLDRVHGRGTVRREVARGRGRAKKATRYDEVRQRIDRADFKQQRHHQPCEHGGGREP